MRYIKMDACLACLVAFVCTMVPLSAQQVAATSAVNTFTNPTKSQVPGSQPQLVQRNPRYVIQRQDVLVLTFPLTPELNQTVTVQPDGYINLQNGGSIYVQGTTVPDVTEALKKAYASTLHNPIINVDLKDFQKPFFTVSGQVGKPGQYDLRTEITVAEAIAIAGVGADCQDSGISLSQDPRRLLSCRKVQSQANP